MRLRYAGPGPQEDGDGGLVRPGDVREFSEEPGWGPWEPVPEPPEAPQAPPAIQAPAPGAEKPPAASTAAPAATSADAGGDGKGM